LERLSVDGNGPFRHRLARERRGRRSASSREPVPQGVVVEQSLDAMRELVCVRRVDYEGARAEVRERPYTLPANDGDAARERLEHRQSEPLEMRRNHDHVRAAVEAAQPFARQLTGEVRARLP